MNHDHPALLISIRNERELDQLLDHDDADGGPLAEIVDLKDPSAGPLAPVSPHLWQIAASKVALAASSELSLALGEFPQAVQIANQVPEGVTYAKMGPSDCADAGELVSRWTKIRRLLPTTVELVAVAYADHQAAGCPPVERVLDAASSFGLNRILIDTFSKDGKSTFAYLSADRCKRISEQMRRQGRWWALAGSVNLDVWQQLRRLGLSPDCIGVRGAVCDGDRQSHLSIARCQQWRAARQAYAAQIQRQAVAMGPGSQ